MASRRKALGLSQSYVATNLGVDQTAVHYWESGKTKPATKRLTALAALLQCSIEELLKEEEKA